MSDIELASDAETRSEVGALMLAAHRHPDDEPEAAHDECADCCSLDLRRMCPDCLHYLMA